MAIADDPTDEEAKAKIKELQKLCDSIKPHRIAVPSFIPSSPVSVWPFFRYRLSVLI